MKNEKEKRIRNLYYTYMRKIKMNVSAITFAFDVTINNTF